MSEFQPLIDQLYREEILRARRMTPAERIAGAFEMTATALALIRAGVRHQFPGATDEEVLAHCRERLRRIRRTQDSGRRGVRGMGRWIASRQCGPASRRGFDRAAC